MKQNTYLFSCTFKLLGIPLDKVNIFSEKLALLSYTHAPLKTAIFYKAWLV